MWENHYCLEQLLVDPVITPTSIGKHFKASYGTIIDNELMIFDLPLMTLYRIVVDYTMTMFIFTCDHRLVKKKK